MTKNTDKVEANLELFRDLINRSNDAIFVSDPHSGLFIFMNDMACASLGYDRQELLKMVVKDIEIAFPDNFSWQTHVNEVRQRGFHKLEGIHKRKNGTTFPVEINVSYVVLNKREYMVAVVRDITERKRAEKEIAERGAMVQQIMDTASVGIGLVDIRGRIIHGNKRMADMFGCAIEELIGSEYVDHVHPSERETSRRNMLSLLASSIPSVDLDRRYLRKDGTDFWGHLACRRFHNAQGNEVGLVGAITDITQRKRMEEALKGSEKLLRESQIVAGLGSYILDMPTGLWTSSEVLDDLFGIDKTYERSVERWEALIHPDDRTMMTDYFRNEVLGQGKPFDKEYRIIRHYDQAERWMHGLGKLEFDTQGRPLKMLGTIQDITSRKKLEERLHQTQKLESLGTLAGGIAHDFNNLLQGIFGYISMAKMSLNQKENSFAVLEQAEKALHQAVNLTTQLLTFSKGGKPVKKLIALQPVIENAARLALSGSGSDSHITMDDGLWQAEVDEGQIGQVIQNIVLNASDAMPSGGIVEISATNVEIAKGEGPFLPEGGRFIKIAIKDSGVGIPEQYLSRIFDPYFTTKQKGSGLGLASAYSIIRKHAGVIDAASEATKGSTFTIYLPASKSKEAEKASKSRHAAVERRGKILVMDDEELIRDVARKMMEQLGHEVECATDGMDAIEKFILARNSGKPFDVVILDLTVKSGMGGEQAINELRKIDPRVKAIVSSGYANSRAVAVYHFYGFAACLKKPYTLDSLNNSLNALLR